MILGLPKYQEGDSVGKEYKYDKEKVFNRVRGSLCLVGWFHFVYLCQ